MASVTTKRGLRKPAGEDFVNVLTDISNNMENLDDAVPDSRKINGHALTSDFDVSKSDVGLGNVDNTSDANKPISNAQGDVNTLVDALIRLLTDNIPGTVASIVYNTDESVASIQHKTGNTVVRADVFTYTDTTITETRTLNTGAMLTIATDLSTLDTTTTYTAA